MILAGKNTTTDGSVLSGHNNDLQGHHAAQLEILEHVYNNAGKEEVLPSGLVIPLLSETQRCLILKTWRGYTEGDAVAVNECQVAIAGGVDLVYDRNDWAKKYDPLIHKGVSGAIRYMALQQSKTARECVERIGAYYSQYGISYPCGVGVTDTKEAWYIEAGGGYTWLAVRIPDDCYFAQANGYRITEADIDDHENVICSPNLIDLIKKNGLWNSSTTKVNFAKIFGGAMGECPNTKYFNNRRLWGCLRKLSPTMHFDSEATEFPMFVKPDKKITVEDFKDVLRDNFEGTGYYAFAETISGEIDRPICVPSCVHSDVIELRDWLPANIGAVMWSALGSPGTSPYIPYYFGTNNIYRPYTIGGPVFDNESAFWRFRVISNLAMYAYADISLMARKQWNILEEDILSSKQYTEIVATEMCNRERGNADDFLSAYSNAFAVRAYEMAKELESEIQTYIATKVHLTFSRDGLEW